MRRLPLITNLCALVLAAPLAPAQVELRGGETLNDDITGVTPAGVALDGPTPRVVSWRLVKRVEGEHAQAASEHAALADDLWRAHERLRRGDLALSAPIFDRLFPSNEQIAANEGWPIEGPTGGDIALGATRVALLQQRQADAARAWIASLALGAHHAGVNDLAEEGSLLLRDLPPIWLGDPRLFALASMPDAAMPAAEHAGARAAALAQIYRWCAAATLSDDPGSFPEIPAATTDDRDVQFARSVAFAIHGGDDTRAEARARLQPMLVATGSWREAWARAAVGLSLLRETNDTARTEGLLHLLHLPARFGDSQPHLAAIALAAAIDELERRRQLDAAAKLRTELEDAFPDHSSASWLDARGEAAP